VGVQAKVADEPTQGHARPFPFLPAFNGSKYRLLSFPILGGYEFIEQNFFLGKKSLIRFIYNNIFVIPRIMTFPDLL
jgi:hypothetical protein